MTYTTTTFVSMAQVLQTHTTTYTTVPTYTAWERERYEAIREHMQKSVPEADDYIITYEDIWNWDTLTRQKEECKHCDQTGEHCRPVKPNPTGYTYTPKYAKWHDVEADEVLGHINWELTVCGFYRKVQQRRRREALSRKANLPRLQLNTKAVPDRLSTTKVTELKGALTGEEWLYIYGKPGTGKTWTLTQLAVERLEEGVYFVTASELMRALMQHERDVTDVVYDIKVLIIDDYEAQYNNDYGTAQMTELIDYRYRRRLPTWISSNVEVEKITDARQRRRIAESAKTIKSE